MYAPDRRSIRTNGSRTVCPALLLFALLPPCAGGLIASRSLAADDPVPAVTEEPRLEISVCATAVLQSAAGPNADGTGEARHLHAPYSADVGFLLPLSFGGTAGLIVESGVGAGPDGQISSISGINADAVDEPVVHVNQCWYERSSGPVQLRAGMIDLSFDIDGNALANSETDQFLSSGFVTNLALELPDGGGPGIVLAVTPREGLELAVAGAEADADWTRVLTRPFLAAQLSWSSPLLGADGTRRAYAWRNSLPHEDLRCSDRGDEPGYGVGLSLDQELAGPVAVFARLAQQRTAVYQVGSSWSAGMQAELPRLGRLEQTFGAAVGRNHATTPWAILSKSEGVSCSDELHYEIYQRIQVSERLSFTADIQRLDSPNGDAAAQRVWVPGLRLHYSR